MTLIIHEKRAFVTREEGFQLPAPFKHWEMMECKDIFMFSKMYSARQGLNRLCGLSPFCYPDKFNEYHIICRLGCNRWNWIDIVCQLYSSKSKLKLKKLTRSVLVMDIHVCTQIDYRLHLVKVRTHVLKLKSHLSYHTRGEAVFFLSCRLVRSSMQTSFYLFFK